MNKAQDPDKQETDANSEPESTVSEADSDTSQGGNAAATSATAERFEAEETEATQAPTDIDSGDAGDSDSDQHGGDAGSEALLVAQEEIARLKDAFLRAKAEQDNVRRRAEKDIAAARKFGVEGFAREIITVRDSLKLALTAGVATDADEKASDAVREGVELTLKQLDTALEKFSVAEIAPAIGDKPDPNLHQAMSMVDSEDVQSGCIVTVVQSGYQLHDRLLRPAMVVVAK